MIYTVTLNPSLDYLVHTEALRPGLNGAGPEIPTSASAMHLLRISRNTGCRYRQPVLYLV